MSGPHFLRQLQHGGARVRGMVWLLVGLCLAAMLFGAGLTVASLAKVRTERAWLLRENARMARISMELRTWADTAGQDLDNLLDPGAAFTVEDHWADGFLGAIAQARTGHEGDLARESVSLGGILDELERQAGVLRTFRASLLQWRQRAAPVHADLATKATLNAIRQRLGNLRASVESVEGQVRLDFARLVRQFRASKGDAALALARRLLPLETSWEGREITAIRRELLEVSRLCEELAGATTSDELTDLKENRFQPSLARIQRALLALSHNTGIQPFAEADLDQLMAAVFGQGYALDSSLQIITPGKGGLYGLKEQELELDAEHITLLAEDTSLLVPLGREIARMQVASAEFADRVGTRIEASMLTNLWSAAALAVVGTACFLTLALYITRGIRGQLSALDSAQESFRLLLESAPDAMTLVDDQGDIVLVNQAAERLFGYGRADMLGQPLEMLLPERFREHHHSQVQDYIKSPGTFGHLTGGLEIAARTKAGREFPADISLSPLAVDGRVYVLSDIRDATERKRNEERIRRNFTMQTAVSDTLQVVLEPLPLEERLGRVLDILLGIPFLGLAGQASVHLANDDGTILTLVAYRGLDSDTAQVCAQLPVGACDIPVAPQAPGTITDPQLAACLGLSAQGPCQGLFTRNQHLVPIRSGEQLRGVMLLAVHPGHEPGQEENALLLAIARVAAGMLERTRVEAARQALQQQLIESEKLSALGRLTANVAHEIRNPLMALGGFARRLDTLLDPGSKAKDYCEVIVSESSRLEKLLHDVLTLTRAPKATREPLDLSTVVQESAKVFGLSAQDHKVGLQQILAPVPPVLADRVQVREALDNLITNAMDAMPDGGELTLLADEALVDGRRFARLQVRDTGVGIAPEKVDKIFEPFFTDKIPGHGQGIGLGLAITRKIMAEHGGQVAVESHQNQGTTFSLLFPVYMQQAAGTGKQSSSTDAA